jgi:Rps23 Pro-64 3,4-dihydroxylase Tpa1-like proline 4-hydroxylase
VKFSGVDHFLRIFSIELIATKETTESQIRRVRAATEKDADRLSQQLIDDFESVMSACILVAHRSVVFYDELRFINDRIQKILDGGSNNE